MSIVAFTKKKRQIEKWLRVKRSVASKQCYSSIMLEKQQLLHVFSFVDGVLLVAAASLSSLSSLS
jgi:hypothetical protein